MKPGGLVMFISSTGTMDAATGNHTRNYLAQRTDLIAAIRLPNTAFKNAGTSVTSDIIILQKLAKGQLPKDTTWVESASYELEYRKFDLNKYFINNPDMMLGTPIISTMYGGRDILGLKPSSKDISTDLASVMAKLPSNIISNDAAMRPNTIPSSPIVSDDDSTSAGTVLIKDEVAMRKTQKGTLTPITKKLQPQAKALLKIKSLVRDVISQQTDTSVNETELEANRKKLNSAYKAYVKKFGRIFDHKLTSRIKPTSFAEQIFSSDPEMYLLRSLELVTSYPKRWDSYPSIFRRLVAPRDLRIIMSSDTIS